MYQTVSFTRQELFEKVWAVPLLKLAQEIGISDVALGKACRRASIPLPGRGYWAKPLSARRKPKLPDSPDADQRTIQFQVLDAASAPKPLLPKEPRFVIPVSATLDDAHPLVAETLKLANKAQVIEGRLALDFKQALHIRVSKDVLDRVLRLLDSLIKTSESRGYRWTITAEGKTVIECDGESMAVEIKERVTKREVPPPKPAPRRGSRWEHYQPTYAYTPTRYEWLPTSELSFHIDAYISGDAQRNWNDTKHTSLDDKLGEILAELPLIVAGLKRKREEHLAWQRKYEEEKRQALDRARCAEIQRLLRKRLMQGLQNWERAGQLRRYCNAVEEQCVRLAPEEQLDATAWLEWARRHADALDPLKKDPRKLTALDVRLPEWFNENSYGRPETDWWTATGTDNE